MSDTSPELILVGAITGARGLKGEVRIKSFTADPKGISGYGDVFEENGAKSYAIQVGSWRANTQGLPVLPTLRRDIRKNR